MVINYPLSLDVGWLHGRTTTNNHSSSFFFRREQNREIESCYEACSLTKSNNLCDFWSLYREYHFNPHKMTLLCIVYLMRVLYLSTIKPPQWNINQFTVWYMITINVDKCRSIDYDRRHRQCWIHYKTCNR